MRTLLKVVMDTTAANQAFADGTLPQIINSVVETIKPEATYFTVSNGKRTGYFFFDMTNSSQMPQIGEILFTKLNAEIELTPVMNQDELKQGLQKAMGSLKR
jgi:hypothetical protein